MKLLPALFLTILCFAANAQNFCLQRIMYYDSKDNSNLTNTQEFFYPGNRGSDYKNGIINYDSAILYNKSHTPIYIYKKTYDSVDRLLTDLTSDISLPSPYYKITEYTNTYDSLGRVTKHSYRHVEHKHNPIYTTTNNTYDSSGRLINTYKTSTSLHMPPQKPYNTNYYYDSAGNNIMTLGQELDTINQVFENRRKDTFEYNSNNLLTKHTVYLLKDSLWEPYQMETASYTTGTKASESARYVYSADSQKLLPIAKYTYEYNNQNDTTQITEYFSHYNLGFLKRRIRQIKYNSYNQPDTVYHYSSNYSSSNPDTQLHFNKKEVHIYQVYWPTNVSNTTDLENNLKIYPVPANNTLNLTAEIKKPQDVTISISDIQGRVLYTHQELSSLSINKKIPVSKLPNGIYILKLSGHNLNLTRKFSIAR